MRVLALSPHLDDAAFSAGALLASLAGAGRDVAVATCFTRSVRRPTGFALACQTDKGYGPEVDYMALRREEDARACRRLGVGYAHWDLLEAPHRGYDSPAALFAGVRADDGAVAGALAQRLRDALRVYRPDVVLYPLCIGDHVDHLQVARAVDEVRAGDGATETRWLRWFDQPYLARHRGRYEGVLAAAQPAGALGDARAAGTDYVLDFGGGAAGAPDAGGEALARKRAACAAYVSQVGYQFFGADGLDVPDRSAWAGRIAEVLGPEEVFRSCG